MVTNHGEDLCNLDFKTSEPRKGYKNYLYTCINLNCRGISAAILNIYIINTKKK